MVIKSHINEVLHGGWPVLLRKARWGVYLLKRMSMSILFHFVCLPFAIPIFLFVRLSSPFMLLRLGLIRGDRLGHYLVDIEVYLCSRRQGLQPDCLDLLGYDSSSCNRQVDIMAKRHLKILPFIKTASMLNKVIPGGRYHEFVLNENSSWDSDGLFFNTPSVLSFTDKEEQCGIEGLKDLGIPEGAEIICFHSRDSEYLERSSNYLDWSYHNYRDTDIATYYNAIKMLADKGYYLVRMGSVVGSPLAIDHPKIIDYASSGLRSDFMDIYLGSICRFFILTPCGISAIPEVFRRPVVYVNLLPIAAFPSYVARSLAITKRLLDVKEKRFLSFNEIYSRSIEMAMTTKAYMQAGVEIVDNTPEEICDVVEEMEARLNGTWDEISEDDELQTKFFKIILEHGHIHKAIHARMGAEFLRKNRELLD